VDPDTAFAPQLLGQGMGVDHHVCPGSLREEGQHRLGQFVWGVWARNMGNKAKQPTTLPASLGFVEGSPRQAKLARDGSDAMIFKVHPA
jgi:hypothetical protein